MTATRLMQRDYDDSEEELDEWIELHVIQEPAQRGFTCHPERKTAGSRLLSKRN
jgi:hypothetical protein